MTKCITSNKPIIAGLTISKEALTELRRYIRLSYELIERDAENAATGEHDAVCSKAMAYYRGLSNAYDEVLDLPMWDLLSELGREAVEC